jgi:FkbM family methyltransferase
MAADIFPSARIYMFDALEESRSYLEKFDTAQFEFQICVLAAESGVEREFAISGTGSSLFSERSDAARSLTKVTTITLDEALETKTVANPVFLKLDVQGAELEVLKGGLRTLGQCELVQMEVALLKYNEGAPDLVEVVDFMGQHGFKLFEIAGFVRPSGRHLVQIDAIFALESSALRPHFFQFK